MVRSVTPVVPGGRRSARGYRRFWLATFVSNLGDGLTVAALPLLAAALTSSAGLVAGLAAAEALPMLLFGVVAGVIVDRGEPRWLMGTVNAARAVAVGLVGLLVAVDQVTLWVLYVTVFVLGVGEAIHDNAAQIFVTALVDEEDLDRANAQRESGELFAQSLVGPPIGAVAFGLLRSLPFIGDAVAFAVSAALLVSIPRSAPDVSGLPPSPRPPFDHRHAWRELRNDGAEGLRWVRGEPVLRALCAVAALANFGVFTAQGVLVLFVRDRLLLPEGAFGLLVTAMAVGGIAGAVVAARVLERIGVSHALAAVLGANAILYGGVGLVPEPVVCAVALTVAGFVGGIWRVATISLRQTIVPAELFGRVNGVYRTAALGAIPLGAVTGGIVADRFGLRAPFLVAGVVCGAAACLSRRGLRNHVVAR